tara:strand:- start:2567 stop:3109 length:543 start_codon:yes stop_codon:yes gene_type:complete
MTSLQFSSFEEVWGESSFKENSLDISPEIDRKIITNKINKDDDSFHKYKIDEYLKKIEVYKKEIEHLNLQVKIHSNKLKSKEGKNMLRDVNMTIVPTPKPNQTNKKKSKKFVTEPLNHPLNTHKNTNKIKDIGRHHNKTNNNITTNTNIMTNIPIDDDNIDTILLILAAIFTILFISQMA